MGDSCRETITRLTDLAYADPEEADDPELASLRQHVATCAACQESVAREQDFLSDLRAVLPLTSEQSVENERDIELEVGKERAVAFLQDQSAELRRFRRQRVERLRDAATRLATLGPATRDEWLRAAAKAVLNRVDAGRVGTFDLAWLTATSGGSGRTIGMNAAPFRHAAPNEPTKQDGAENVLRLALELREAAGLPDTLGDLGTLESAVDLRDQLVDEILARATR